ncbi:unnamed protein product [Brassica rapa subsp. narinosa]
MGTYLGIPESLAGSRHLFSLYPKCPHLPQVLGIHVYSTSTKNMRALRHV